MTETQSILAPWSSFYVMTGSSAAALTGLMFVVITLVTRIERSHRTRDGVATFSTPTVMHFSAALLLSAVLAAPWGSLVSASLVTGLTGLCGFMYIARITFLTRRLSTYTPDTEDWAWYGVMPTIAYAAIFIGAIALLEIPAKAMFVVAGGVVLLIFTGIRNAWDVVTYLAIEGPQGPPQ